MREKIYEMKLHQTIYLREEKCSIMRVASGWIYKFDTIKYNNLGVEYNEYFTTIFVPEDINGLGIVEKEDDGSLAFIEKYDDMLTSYEALSIIEEIKYEKIFDKVINRIAITTIITAGILLSIIHLIKLCIK